MANGFRDGRQRPPPVGDDGKAFNLQLKARGRAILNDLMAMLPSIYRSEIPSSEYARHLETFAREMARISLTLEQLRDDVSFEEVRSEFLQQVVGYLVFVGEDLPDLEVSDERFRELLLTLTDLYFEGTTPEALREGVEFVTSKSVVIEEGFEQTEDVEDFHRISVRIDADGSFSSKMASMRGNLELILNLIRPAHTIFGITWVFSEVFDIAPGADESAWTLNEYLYDDVRKNWSGLAGFDSSGGEVRAGELDRIYEAASSKPVSAVEEEARLIVPTGPNAGRYRVQSVDDSSPDPALVVHPYFKRPEGGVTYSVEIDRRGMKEPKFREEDVSDQFRRHDRLKLEYDGPSEVNWTETNTLSFRHNYKTEPEVEWSWRGDGTTTSTERSPEVVFWPNKFRLISPVSEDDRFLAVYSGKDQSNWGWEVAAFTSSGSNSFDLAEIPEQGTERVYHKARLLVPSEYGITGRTITITGPSVTSGDEVDVYYHTTSEDYERDVFQISSSTDEVALSSEPNNEAAEVFLNGKRVIQGSGEDYTVDGSDVTFSSALSAGDVVDAIYRLSAPNLTRSKYTAVSDSDDYVVTDGEFSPRQHFLYRNGKLLRHDRERGFAVAGGDLLSVIHDPIGTRIWEWRSVSGTVSNPVNPSVEIGGVPFPGTSLVFVGGVLLRQDDFEVSSGRLQIDPSVVSGGDEYRVLWTPDHPSYRLEEFDVGSDGRSYDLAEQTVDDVAYVFLNGKLLRQGSSRDYAVDDDRVELTSNVSTSAADEVTVVYWTEGESLQRTDHTAANSADDEADLPGYVDRSERITFLNGELEVVSDLPDYEVAEEVKAVVLTATSWDGKKSRAFFDIKVS